MAEQKSLALTTASAETTTIRIVAVSADTAVIDYRTLPGNQPEAYRNMLYVWQGSAIGYDRPPLSATSVRGNNPDGVLVVSGIDFTRIDYTFGYAVGPLTADVCAAAFLPREEPPTYADSSVLILEVSPNAVVIRYMFPPGFNPAQNGAGISLWQGKIGLYQQPPLARSQITSTSNTGVATVEAQLQFGMAYTVTILTSPSPTTLAAWATFTT